MSHRFVSTAQWANSGGEDAGKIVRIAFAVIVKLSGDTPDVLSVSNDIEKLEENMVNFLIIRNRMEKVLFNSQLKQQLLLKGY